MATQAQINANRLNAQKSTGPTTPEGKAKSRRNGLKHGLTAEDCMLAGEKAEDLLDLLEELREKYDPQDTDEEFLIERMAKARFKFNRVMPLEAAIMNLRLSVDQAPGILVKEQGDAAQRAWAFMRDANGGNALSKLARYETSLLREYDRSRQELVKMQKARTAKAPAPAELQTEPNALVPTTKSVTSKRSTKSPGTPTRAPQPDPASPSQPTPRKTAFGARSSVL